MTAPSKFLRPFLIFAFGFCGALAAPRAEALSADSDTSEIVDSSIVMEASRLEDSILFEESPVARHPKLRPYSLTFSPVHLIGFLTAEAMLERAFDSHTSAAAFGAVGFPFPALNGRTYELGGQLRWYPTGQGRHAMHFGVEAFWAHVSFSFEDEEGSFFDDWEGAFELMGAGPFFGYKFTSQGGAVIEFQFGYQAIALMGDVLPYPILNFNVGQAF